MYIGLQESIHYSCPILMKLEFSGQFLKKNIPISDFIQIYPVGEELVHVDRHTDMTKLLVALRNFATCLQTNKIYCFGLGRVQEV
jgi:hypothetical protein